MINSLSKHNKKHGTQYRTLPNSWLFLSRTSALKEYSFMKALWDVGYPTPKPIAQNRHVVVMGLVRGVPLYQLHSNRVSAYQAESIFMQCAALAGRLARHGLVHCDLNEFNLMVDLSGVQGKIASCVSDEEKGETHVRDWEDDATEHYVRHSGMPVQIKGALSAHAPLQRHRLVDGTGEAITESPPEPAARLENGEPKPIVILIDFPQMVSIRHPNAKELYERDVVCLKSFFGKKLRCFVEGEGSEDGKFVGIMPKWEDLVWENASNKCVHDREGGGADDITLVSKAQLRLDEELKASGYSKEDAARDSELAYYEVHQQMSRGLTRVEDDDEDEGNEDHDDDESKEGENDNVGVAINQEPEENIYYNGDDSVDEDQAPELIQLDEFLPPSRKHSNNGDGASFAGGISLGGMSQLSYTKVEQRASERVRRHLEEKKKAAGRKGAFKTRNSNKSYVKGRRILNDFGL